MKNATVMALGATARAALVIGAVLALAVPALAQKTEPKLKNIGATGVSKKRKKQTGPGFSLETKRKKKRKATKESIEASIENQKMILELEPKSSVNYPKMKIALADFYWDLSEWYDREAHSDALEQKIFDAEEAKKPAEMKRVKAYQADLFEKMKDYRSLTTDTYSEVIDDFPNLKNMDEIRYYLGYHLTMMKEMKRSAEVYKGLIRNHPDSKYVPDALVNVGELWFAENDFANALQMYEAAASEQYKSSPVYNYAIYKQGWCHYNLGRYAVSLGKHKTVIENTRALVKKSGQKGAIDLQKEAQNDMVLPYAKTGKPKGAIKFFKEWAPKRYLTLASRLAGVYTDETEYEKSNSLLRTLIKEAKRTKGKEHLILTFQRQIVDNSHSLGDKAKTVAEVQILIKLYEELRGGGAPPKFLKKEAASIDNMILTIAFGFHQEYKSTKNQKTLDYTQMLYDEYLRLFPNKKDSYAILTNTCILKEMVGKFDEAAICYEKVITAKPDGLHAREAAERLVIVLLESYKGKGRKTDLIKSKDKAADLEKAEIGKEGLRFLNAVDLWFKVLDKKRKDGKISKEDNDNIPKALYLAALTYYEHNHFAEAATRFGKFVDEFPDHEWTPEAAIFVLSAYNLARDVQSLKRYADKLKADKRYYRGEVKEKIDIFYKEFEFLQCFKPEKEKRHLEAASCFLRYESNHATSEKAPKALYNAAYNYFAARRVEEAINTQKKLYDKFGRKDKEGTKALYAIGEIFRETTVYDQAAEIYELFVNNHPQHELAEKALRYASTFRKTLGQYDKAVKNLELYLANYGKGNKNAARVDLDIILIREKQERPKQVIYYAKRHLKRFKKKESAKVKLRVLGAMGKAYKANDKGKDATATFEKTVSTYRSLNPKQVAALDMPAIASVAEAHFNLGSAVLRSAKRIKLEGNEAKIKKLTQKKLKAINETKRIFNAVIGYNHPGWAIAGFFALGTAYENLADTIENSEIPRKIRRMQDVVDEYKAALSEQAEKIRNVRAIPAYQNALKIARVQNWFNEWSEKAENALARIDLKDTSIKEYRLRPVATGANRAIPNFYQDQK